MSNRSSSVRFVDKYRPRKLSAVAGQEKVVAQLQGMISDDKLRGNTLLLSGPYGVGKTTLARILARTINCKEHGDAPCGECRSCLTKIESHPDIVEINAASTRGIDDVRTIIETSRLHPRHEVRVFILDELHQLTGPAAQAFLKELEEPKSHLLYILCTTEPYSLLPTIRSRSTWLKLGTVAARDISRFLRKVCRAEDLQVSPAVLKHIAEISGGHVRDALTLLDQISSAADLSSMTDEDAERMIPELSEGILGASPSYLVPKYVAGIIKCELSPLIHVRKVDDLGYFLGLVTKFLKEYLIYRVQEDAVDSKDIVSFAKLMGPKCITRPLLLSVLNTHIDLQERVARHLVDPLDAIDSVILGRHLAGETR